jgi:hypothetical protein
MIGNKKNPYIYHGFIITSFLLLSFPRVINANDEKIIQDCLSIAIENILRIRSLPNKEYLHTLDGQYIQLSILFNTCENMFPWCCLFTKFYYWKSEIRQFDEFTVSGKITYTARCYFSCLSTCCPTKQDSLKTHGDVAEFYNLNGDFIGLGVYMGNGKYVPIPYD